MGQGKTRGHPIEGGIESKASLDKSESSGEDLGEEGDIGHGGSNSELKSERLEGSYE